jgi:rhodanese-related sulfurtransferase
MDARPMNVRRGVLVGLVLLAVFLGACSSDGSGEGSSGGSGASWTQLSPTELDTMMKDQDVFLVNVHVPYEGQIPGTDAFIPYDQIASRIDELPSDPSTLVIYCRTGHTSGLAAQALAAAGYTGFYELAGGYTAWTQAGLPFVVQGPTN